MGLLFMDYVDPGSARWLERLCRASVFVVDVCM